MKWPLGVVLAGLSMAVSVYLGAGAYLYISLSGVKTGYGADIGNTPTQIVSDLSAYPTLDSSQYTVQRFDEVSFPGGSPGVTVNAWLIPRSGSDKCVIIVSGHNSSKASPKSIITAGMLHRMGITVLMIDVRDQGMSSVEDHRTALGVNEYLDVLAAKKWLKSQGFLDPSIALVGGSLGAATALIAFGQDASIPAVWSDSSFGSPDTTIENELHRNGFPKWMASSGILMGRLISNVDLVGQSPQKAMKLVGNRRIRLVHSRNDARVPFWNAQRLLDSVPPGHRDRVTTWFPAHDGHCDLMMADPIQFEAQLADFFSQVWPAR